ncbi:hypothetical protein C1H46_043791 [Malus baccata]|uniref:Purple acid phosphatase Fn3-like domain-containing protein n=1 Tax=Malus baccata TaxID=106549 RepID=A0A540K8X6_MALBA|nr:hypothetical protein C1H46_043791 [Malus baccata]
MESFFSFLSLKAAFLLIFLVNFSVGHKHYRNKEGGDGVQPLSKILIHKTVHAIHEKASVHVYPVVLGTTGKDYEWVTVNVVSPNPSANDWLGVFSPAKFK